MKHRRYLYLILSMVLLSAFHLAAQQVQEFTGRVIDPTGAVVRKAVVIAHNVDSGVNRSTTTTSSGDCDNSLPDSRPLFHIRQSPGLCD